MSILFKMVVITTCGYRAHETCLVGLRKWVSIALNVNLNLNSHIVFQSLSHVQLFVTPRTAACHGLCPSLSPRVCSDSCPLRQCCYLIISSSAARFSSWLQSLPASGSFPVSQLFESGGQSIGASASASVLPMNSQG